MTNKRKQTRYNHFRHPSWTGMQDSNLLKAPYYEAVDESSEDPELQTDSSEYESEILDIDTVRRRLGLISTAELAPEENSED